MLEILKKLRTEAGISQKALADAVGTSQQSINKYENHNIEPDIETLIRIADRFECSVDYLIGHTTLRCKIEPTEAVSLNADEAHMLALYRQLTLPQREQLTAFLQSFLQPPDVR